MSTASDLIRKIDFFEPLDDRTVERIAEACIPREYSPGNHIVRQGDPGLGLYFITDGWVKVEIERDGTKTAIAELKAGDFVGEISIIDNKPRTANVICLADTSCLLLTRDSFQKLLKKYPEIAVQMIQSLASRLRETDERFGFTRVIVPAPVAAPPAQAAAPQEQPAEPPPALALVRSFLRLALSVVDSVAVAISPDSHPHR
jgi:CRP-like cAMP-binding protein